MSILSFQAFDCSSCFSVGIQTYSLYEYLYNDCQFLFTFCRLSFVSLEGGYKYIELKVSIGEMGEIYEDGHQQVQQQEDYSHKSIL